MSKPTPFSRVTIGGMESLKFGIIEAYIYRLADNANFVYPDGGYKSYSEANGVAIDSCRWQC